MEPIQASLPVNAIKMEEWNSKTGVEGFYVEAILTEP